MDGGSEGPTRLALSLFVGPKPSGVDVTVAHGVNTMESRRRRGSRWRGEKLARDLPRFSVASLVKAESEK